MSIHTTVQKLNDRVRNELAALWDRYESEDIDFEEFTALATAVITRAAQRARAIGDLSVAAQLTQLTRQIAVPSGVEPDETIPSEASAAIREQTETQSYDHDPRTAMGIAGAAVVMAAMQKGISDAMRTNRVEYFTRTANPGACEICTEMEGVVLPADVPMWHHKGCMCVPTITIYTNE